MTRHVEPLGPDPLRPKPPPADIPIAALAWPYLQPFEIEMVLGVRLVLPLGAPPGSATPPLPKQSDVPMGPLAFYDVGAGFEVFDSGIT